MGCRALEPRMRRPALLALASFVAGIALLSYSVAIGESRLYLVLIFPVVAGSGSLGLAGILLVVAAIFLGFLSFARSALGGIVVAEEEEQPSPPSAPGPSEEPRKTKFGGVVFLGPIPIVFGSDARVSNLMLVLAVAMTILLLAFFFLVLPRAP